LNSGECLILVFLVVTVHLVSDCTRLTQCPKLLGQIICDKGYDSEAFRTFVKEHGGETVIAKRNYGQDIDKTSMDWCLYKYRHLVENASLHSLQMIRMNRTIRL
jgi:transposase